MPHGRVRRFIAHRQSSLLRYAVTALACAASLFAGGYILLFVGKLDLGQSVGLMVATFVALLGLCVTAYVFVRTSSDAEVLSGSRDAGGPENAFRSSVLRSFQKKLGLIIGFGLAFIVLSLIASGMSYSGYSAYDYPVQGRMGAFANGLLSSIRLLAYKYADMLSEVAVMGVAVMIALSASYVWAVIAYRSRMEDEARWQSMVIEDVLDQTDSKGEPNNFPSTFSKESFEKVLGNILSIYSYRLNIPSQSLDMKNIEKSLRKKPDNVKKDGQLVLLLVRYSDACKELADVRRFCKKQSEPGNWSLVQPVAENLWGRFVQASVQNGDGHGAPADSGKCKRMSVNVVGHDFSNSSFRGALMPRSEFLECELDGVSFDGADLSHSNFRGSSLTHIEIVQSKWERPSQLPEGSKETAGFMGARFDRALMTSVKIFGNSKEDGCLFSQSVFTDANLNDLDVQKVLLEDCSFLNASMYGAHFKEVRLVNTEFVEARMTGADFRNVDLDSCNMRRALLLSSEWEETTITDTSLEAASFIGASLSDTTLLAAYCSRAIFQKATIEHSGFRQTVLWDADFTGAQLSEVVFLGSQLDGSLFRYCEEKVAGCEITGSSAVNVSFMGTAFDGCTFKRTTFVSSSFQSCTFKDCRFIECDLRDVRFDGSDMQEGCRFINCFGMNDATYGSAEMDGASIEVQPDMLKGASSIFIEARSQPAIRYLRRGEWNVN